MGKTFITDETNDMYTAQVTNAGKLQIETGAAKFKKLGLNSIYHPEGASCTGAVDEPCYFKALFMGQSPVTATTISIYDGTTAAIGSDLSSWGSSGDHIIARWDIQPSGDVSEGGWVGISAAAATYPKLIPFNVYCTSGLIVTCGEGQSYAALSGECSGVSIIYQT